MIECLFYVKQLHFSWVSFAFQSTHFVLPKKSTNFIPWILMNFGFDAQYLLQSYHSVFITFSFLLSFCAQVSNASMIKSCPYCRSIQLHLILFAIYSSLSMIPCVCISKNIWTEQIKLKIPRKTWNYNFVGYIRENVLIGTFSFISLLP